ncbi:MAG: hypothetical protein KDA65_17380, partial [Planctomycetaceae bacterium]|nr:hypothetical protein [Planctomycetaceae bacterium]
MPFVASIAGLLLIGLTTSGIWLFSDGQDPAPINVPPIANQQVADEVGEDTFGLETLTPVSGTIQLAATDDEPALRALADRQNSELDEIPLQPIPDIDFATQVESFTKKFCIDCHGPDAQEGGLELHKYDSILSMRQSRKTWKHIYQLVEISAMPPVDMEPQPTKEEREKFVQ